LPRKEALVKDPRHARLAQILVRHSTRVQPGERVLIEAFDVPPPLVTALIQEVTAAGGVPLVSLKNAEVHRALLRHGNEDQLRLAGDVELYRMKQVQCYIGVRGATNVSELSDVPSATMRAYSKNWSNPVHLEQRVKHTKWVVLRYPTPSMAQQANTSTEAFEEFYFRVCDIDYGRLSAAMDPLVARLQRTDRVRLVGPGTDLRFSIRGIPAIKCDGERNIPDGECYTAPVKDSVEGTISYNAPALYEGITFENIRFEFRQGKIVRAEASANSERLNQILDTDEGARYIGEFSLGFNPHILKPMKDALFDEKIAGSLHFTPGSAYEAAENGNRSAIHWDLVLIQRPDYGGGEIWFDDELIRKDGRFVVPDLEGLNPESLSA
jgi:aminopeptidase